MRPKRMQRRRCVEQLSGVMHEMKEKIAQRKRELAEKKLEREQQELERFEKDDLKEEESKEQMRARVEQRKKGIHMLSILLS